MYRIITNEKRLNDCFVLVFSFQFSNSNPSCSFYTIPKSDLAESELSRNGGGKPRIIDDDDLYVIWTKEIYIINPSSLSKNIIVRALINITYLYIQS